ncbi:alpha-1,2-fucosyltransferase [Mucilaginibacter sp.]
MIIVRLQGGLGNQLFQYAFGKKLAIQNHCELKIDTSFYRGQNLRSYLLYHFSIKENFATINECNELRERHFSKLNRLLRKYLKTKLNLIEEKSLLFDPQYLKIKNYTYLSGYWQSEEYFKDISAEIRAEFNVKTPTTIANQILLDQIVSCNAVSLHIRRGDFVIDNAVSEIHGTCGLEYYTDAAKLLASQITDPIFYVFSDDIPWAKKHLKLSQMAIFVDINDGFTAFEDIRLMQHCRHNIIANSTFSWWGAWLNPNPDKIVVAPKIWFADPAMNLQSASIVPDKWIRL